MDLKTSRKADIVQKKYLLQLLFFFSLPVVLLMAHIFPSGEMLYYRDFWQLYYPHFHWGASVIQEGSVPLWNPYIGAGYPVFASMVHGYAYPPFWFSLLFSVEWAIKLYIAGHLFWAGLGMYWLCRQWKLSVYASVFCGISFMLSGPLVSGANNLPYLTAPAWLPWALGCYTLAQTNKRWIVPTAIVMAFMALAGEAQTCYLSGLLFVFFSLAHAKRQNATRSFLTWLLRMTLIIFVALMIASIQIWPALEFGLQSERVQGVSDQDALSFSLYWEDLPRFWIPFIYGNPTHLWYGRVTQMQAPFESSLYLGLLPLFFGGVGLFGTAPRARKIFLIGGFFFFFFASLGNEVPLYQWLRKIHLPLWSSFRYPEKLLLPTTFLWILLVGFGFDHWFSETFVARKKVCILNTLLLALVIFGTLIFLPPFKSSHDTLNQQAWHDRQHEIYWCVFWSLLSTLTLITSYKTQQTKIRWGLSLLLLCELVFYHRQILPTKPLSFYHGGCPSSLESLSRDHFYRVSLLAHEIPAYRGYPLEPFVQSYRKWGLGNLTLLYEVYQDWGIMPTVFNTYATLRNAMDKAVHQASSITEKAQNPLLQRLAIKRAILKIEDPLLTISSRLLFLDVPNPRPRFSLLFQTASAQNESEALKKMATLPAEVAVILEQDATLNSLESFPLDQGSLELFASSPNEIRLRVSVPKPAYLLISDNFSSGWYATLNEKSVALIRADLNFRLMCIPAGTHSIRMFYQPRSFYTGLIISLFSGIVILLWGFKYKHDLYRFFVISQTSDADPVVS